MEIIKKTDGEYVKFDVSIEMKSRWVCHFLAMLQYMEHLGTIGSSRYVTFYADGDGDFRPKFSWDNALPSGATPIKEEYGNRTYDAG